MEEQAEEGSEFYEGANVDDNFDDDGSVNGDDDVVLEGTIALYKPPSYLEQICSSTSLQTPQGFDSCSKACKPSRCCNPEKYGCDVDDYLYCELYKKPCKVVEESWRGSGHAVASSSMRDDDDDDHGGNPFHSVGVGGKNDDDDDNDDDSDEDYDSAIANTVMSACNSANLNPPDKCIEACYPGACCYVTNTFPPIEIFFDKKYGAVNNPPRSHMRQKRRVLPTIRIMRAFEQPQRYVRLAFRRLHLRIGRRRGLSRRVHCSIRSFGMQQHLSAGPLLFLG